MFEDRKVKADVIAQNPGGDRRRRHLRLQHLDAADHLARRRVQGPGALHRHPFLLAGRPHDADRDHPRQGDRRQGARRRARLRARHPQDADRRQRYARLLRQPLRDQLPPGRPPDAAGGHPGGDDREHRAHGRHAGRPACRSTTRPRSISASRSCARPKPISARRRSIRGRRSCSRTWSRSAAASAARTARASTIIRKASPSGCGRASPICCRRSFRASRSRRIDVEELKQRFLVVQAVEAARSFEEKVVTDVREADVGSILGWGFAPYTGGTLSYIDMMGTQEVRRDLPQVREEIRRRALRRPSCSSTWRPRTSVSIAASRRRSRKRRRKHFPTLTVVPRESGGPSKAAQIIP